MDSQSSLQNICIQIEGKLDLQDFSNIYNENKDLATFEPQQGVLSSDDMDLEPLEVNNFHVCQSPQPHLADEEANEAFDNIQPISDPIIVQETEDKYNPQENHLLDPDLYEDSISSSYNSSSNSNVQSIESNEQGAKAREGKIIETKSKVNLSRCHPHTLFLNQFFARGKNYPPKKEYIRVTVIRSHKKLNRYIEQNKPLSKVVQNLNINSPAVKEIVKKLKLHYDQNIEVFKQAAKTESGPKTDGSKKNKNPKSKSWNNTFVKEYFENRVILESFLLHIDLIFADCDIETLSKRLKIQCCKNDNHNSECNNKWEQMKEFLSEKIITDLGLSVPEAANRRAVLTNVEAIPERVQGFGNEVIDSYLESNQEIK